MAIALRVWARRKTVMFLSFLRRIRRKSGNRNELYATVTQPPCRMMR